jgi:hypothetical protein
MQDTCPYKSPQCFLTGLQITPGTQLATTQLEGDSCLADRIGTVHRTCAGIVNRNEISLTFMSQIFIFGILTKSKELWCSFNFKLKHTDVQLLRYFI